MILPGGDTVVDIAVRRRSRTGDGEAVVRTAADASYCDCVGGLGSRADNSGKVE